MNKKGYNKARKSRYNIIVEKGDTAKAKIEKMEADKPKDFTIRTFDDMKKSVVASNTKAIKQIDAKLANERKRDSQRWMPETSEKEKKLSESRKTLYDSIIGWKEAEAVHDIDRSRTLYGTLADWLAENKPEKMLIPIHCELWHFCRKQRTRESIDCMTYSDNGFKKITQYYEDYMQSILAVLVEMAIDNPEDNFGDALAIATKKGMYNCFSDHHYFTKEESENGKKKTVAHTWKSTDKPLNDETSTCLSDLIKDPFANTEAKAIARYNKSIGYKPYDYIIEKCKDDLEIAICEGIANGYTYKQIATFSGTNEQTCKNKVHRMKKRFQIERQAERTERAKAEAEKPETVRKPEAIKACYHPWYKPELHNVPNTVDSFKKAVGNGSLAIVTTYNVMATEAGTATATATETITEKAVNGGTAEHIDYMLEKRIVKADIKQAEIAMHERSNMAYYNKLYNGIGNYGKKPEAHNK